MGVGRFEIGRKSVMQSSNGFFASMMNLVLCVGMIQSITLFTFKNSFSPRSKIEKKTSAIEFIMFERCVALRKVQIAVIFFSISHIYKWCQRKRHARLFYIQDTDISLSYNENTVVEENHLTFL